MSEAHSPSWLATEHEMANEEREMKEFTKRNLQQIKELKDGHHSVRPVRAEAIDRAFIIQQTLSAPVVGCIEADSYQYIFMLLHFHDSLI